MDSQEVRKTAELIANTVNRTPELVDFVKKWVDKYIGKTIGFRFPDYQFFITFSPEEVSVNDGEPASFDLLLISSPETISTLMSKEASWSKFRGAMRSGEILIWGNLHEARPFLEVIARAFEVQET